ncbi:hypothetical protein FXO37_00403 [Capsicum annuum]|nr:hypothetical protein FXO37_00403 [Capsicum annuum]
MADFGGRWKIFRPLLSISWSFLLAAIFVSAERSLKRESVATQQQSDADLLTSVVQFLWKPNESGYEHVWPELKFDWQIVVGTIIGFLGAAFGSVGGVGGGGIFVPMLSLIIGFDPKSSTAISKCMIMGASVSTVYYNLKLKHPTIDIPIIDYDLAVLIQPMLMLGISIGVTFNVIFADWMESEAAKKLGANDAEYKLLPGDSNAAEKEEVEPSEPVVPIMENVCWKETGLLCFVWVAFLGLQIGKVPVALSVSSYEAFSLYKGWRRIESKGEEGTNFRVLQLFVYCFFGILAGMVGGLLGLGGGFIMGPMFLELGVPPQVSSATATFAMMFSSSMSVVEYYLLKRFPVPYALYFIAVATVAAFIGQHVVRKMIMILGRASLIIFILAFTIFVSAISLGGVGISNMIGKIQRHEYMGFENLCKYDP